MDTFLLTYRTYVTPSELLTLLTQRYNIQPAKPLEECREHEKQTFFDNRRIIRLRIANLIKRWLSNHFHDFLNNEELENTLMNITRDTFGQNEPNLGQAIAKSLEEAKVRTLICYE